ncbi:MAG: hypothetical protein A3E88_00770 [Legionellales bacterium RIFCSPHIGHO2_12_FULL_35_11]|nr:MAG: hypothetical protein A3E88_00770 [Legionellales bacterium RIFCSPHIGHO2_12_FULL_35_11]
MAKLREKMQKYLQLFLTNKQFTLLCTLILALFPYTSWLAVVVIAFITLRNGWMNGLTILLPVALVYFACSLVGMPAVGAFVNMLALFFPCYFAACVLRMMTNWQAVFGLFFLMIALTSIFVQLLAPDFVVAQFLYLENFVKETQTDASVTKLLSDLSNINQTVVASYAFGLQILSIFFSATMSLMAARSLQSRLFNIGGFKQEMLSFRATKISIAVFIILLIAATRLNLIAMTLLPTVIVYFLLAGLSISASFVNRKNSRLLLLLIVPLILAPFVSAPFYTILGLFDSVFNLRFYKLKPRNRG